MRLGGATMDYLKIDFAHFEDEFLSSQMQSRGREIM